MEPASRPSNEAEGQKMKSRSLLLAFATAAALAVASFPGTSLAQTNAAPAAPGAPTAATVVANVQTFYNATTTFSADFTQTYTVKAYNQTKTSTGHVVFNKPGKMDWTYKDPAGNRVVSDGTTVWVYEAANKQMYQQAVSQAQYPAALAFLTGQGDLAKLFDFQLFDGAQMQFPGGYVLAGTPKTATAAYEKVLFYVDGPTSQVRRVLILDGQGNRNRFDFTAPVVNQPVPATQFVFTPPPGTTVIKP
jgi:outer membrane lipoprotein carrier protein